jgi:putative colanic acid biosynthesis UDP-glucose lipid carrier transferase
MIRSREVGLFNAYSFALTGILTVCFWVCFAAIHLLGIRELFGQIEPYLAYSLISVGGLLLQLYQTDSNRVNVLALDAVQNLRISISQSLHVAGALAVMLVLTKDLAISRLFLLVYLCVLPMAFFAANASIPSLLSHLFFTGDNQIPALLIGRLDRVGRMRRWLRRMESYGVSVVGLLSEEKTPKKKTIHRIPIVGEARDLQTILNTIRIETVILLDVPKDPVMLNSLVDIADRAGARMIVANNLAETFKHSLRFYRQFGVDFITLRDEPLQDPLNRLLKRAFDFTFSLGVVVLLLPPLTLLVWLIQRTQSPGPLFFRQTRAGIQNRRFEIIKFRTMHTGRFETSQQATEADERVFSLGRLLRKTSIDEIPQFLNVLRGEMSVVGPRPHMLEHNEQFAKIMASYHVRTLVKPGVTGLAQVSGFRGEARKDEDIRRRVACDIDYIERWSLLLDAVIILQTSWQVLRPPRSAY